MEKLCYIICGKNRKFEKPKLRSFFFLLNEDEKIIKED